MCTVHYVFQNDALIDIGAHVFPIEKYHLLARLVREELGVAEDRMHGWDPVAERDLARVHGPAYLDDLRLARVSAATLLSELPVTPAVIDGFRAMTGGSIVAVRLAVEHGVGFHIGGGFHHAFPTHAEGFCYIHDMAVAVEKLRAEQGPRKVLYVDVDVHQGNGTAVVYQDRDDTFTYSIHQENNYPLKQRSDLDRGLPDRIEDEEYLALLRRDLDRIEAEFTPELVCYVAGVDPFQWDQLGGLSLTAEGLAARDAIVLDRYLDRDVPVAIFTAGGYAPTAEQTARLHLGTAKVAERACARSQLRR